MQKVIDFIKNNMPFFVGTINEDAPAIRPFGAIMLYQGDLYITTGVGRTCYYQMINGAKVQLLSMKHGTREWLRVNCIAQEETSVKLKELAIKENPVLENIYAGATDPTFALIKLKVLGYEFK